MTQDNLRRNSALDAADIVILSCFGVAQPLFGILSRSEGLFIIHGSRPVDIVLLTFGAMAVPAIALLALEWFTAAASRPRTGPPRVMHQAVVTLLLTLILLPIINRMASIPALLALCLAIAASAALSIQYLRVRTWRWSAAWLLPALLLFPALFLFHSPITTLLFPGRTPDAVRARVGNPVPVVMLVFDEFPLASLLDADGNINAARYPNFAALSHSASWYRNATTAAESTLISVPAILDGKYPDPDRPRLPNAAGHPNNLFTLLGGSYRMNVIENNTRLCPEALCAHFRAPFASRFKPLVQDAGILWLYRVLPSGLTHWLPDISQNWGNFADRPANSPTLADWNRFDDLTDWKDRQQEFHDFLTSLQPSHLPTLHFLHILLPHAPWEYLPSGRRYPVTESGIRGLRGANNRGEDPNFWGDDTWATVQSYQRHLLQVGFVDRLVGELMARLRETGLYDSSLIVITADHGTSFRPGDSRRTITPTNHADIMAVPLFIKYPNQQTGGADDRNVENVDIFPTVAAVLKVKPAAPIDGKSLLSAEDRPARAKYVVTIDNLNQPDGKPKLLITDAGKKLEFKGGLADLFASVKYKLGIFSDQGHNGLYRAGDRYGLSGRAVSSLKAASGSGIKAQIDHETYYSKVDLNSPILATGITGHIRRIASSPDGADPIELAVAVNGTVHAVTRTFREGDEESFSAMVPETSLRAGRNDIGLFLVRNEGRDLVPLELESAPTWAWEHRLNFGKGGNAQPFFGTGWSGPEDKLTWTEAHAATLFLPGTPPHTDLVLRAFLGAFTRPGKVEEQHVRISVNRHEVGEWVVGSEFQEFHVDVPRQSLTESEVTEIIFELPDAVAPIAIGAGNDSRTLGVAVSWVQFTPKS